MILVNSNCFSDTVSKTKSADYYGLEPPQVKCLSSRYRIPGAILYANPLSDLRILAAILSAPDDIDQLICIFVIYSLLWFL